MAAQDGPDNIRAFQGGTTGSLDPNAHADALQHVVDAIPPIAYCDYSTNPVLLLTTTPTILTAWTSSIAPIGISQLAGVFTVAPDGVYKIDLERVYQNDDNNPLLLVNVTIDVEFDDQQGGGFVSMFTRTVPISSATATDEPAILSFTTPANLKITATTEFRILVSAEDNGGNPQECYFVRGKVVANLIHKLP